MCGRAVLVFLSFQRPSVSATALFWPNSSNGNEFTRYPVPVPVAIAGSAPVIRTFPRAMGPSTASLTVAASASTDEAASTRYPLVFVICLLAMLLGAIGLLCMILFNGN